MEINIYSIYDKKTQVYQPLFQEVNDESAMRFVAFRLMDGESILKKWPSDYSLTNIGRFDQKKGTIKGSNARIVIELQELIQKPKSEEKVEKE